MALRKKQRSGKTRKRRSVRLSAFQQGHINGFRKGKEDGFAQGRADAVKKSQSAVAVAIPDHPAADVLVITAGFIPSLEIGVLQPLSALNKLDNLRYDVKQEDEVSHEMIEAADAIVFVRNVEPEAYTWLELALQLRKRTIYVIDDNFLEIQPTTAVGQYYADPVRRETFIKFLRNAHIVKVDAQELGAYIEERFNKNVVYFPASVDFDWLDEQKRNEREHEQIVIGYEGGAKEEDFAPVIPALHKILDYYGGFVRMEFFGYVPVSLADHPSVHFEEGGMNYKDFIKKLNRCNWDIGIAPLNDNPFNRSKTNNKLREYGACRIPGIYSNSPVYAPWVTQGETGYLVKHTEQDWFEGIKAMIENPTMRLRIRENAEASARQHFSLHTCIDNWKKFILKK
ncbi:glycosyltransferase [Paenibacillus mendelii]|uniref:Glycosyltransferase n=1 Tax=Paenibacillus mendelii TaxID=206163 RepID=A0ABV6J961_9BACL|nr:glycosyltransferase [Paenibacillus mendelii]MCQ6559729.1 glycosyltransferase [Paenibacillus mendelii]